MIGRTGLATGAVLLAGIVTAGSSLAQDDYDNPKTLAGNAPCVTVNEYLLDEQPGEGDEVVYQAWARLENICGRTMEVSACFVLAEETDAGDRVCYDGLIRPGAEATVMTDETATRIVEREIQWRYLPQPSLPSAS